MITLISLDQRNYFFIKGGSEKTIFGTFVHASSESYEFE